jgi:hypothetical protein
LIVYVVTNLACEILESSAGETRSAGFVFIVGRIVIIVVIRGSVGVGGGVVGIVVVVVRGPVVVVVAGRVVRGAVIVAAAFVVGVVIGRPIGIIAVRASKGIIVGGSV